MFTLKVAVVSCYALFVIVSLSLFLATKNLKWKLDNDKLEPGKCGPYEAQKMRAMGVLFAFSIPFDIVFGLMTLALFLEH